MKDWVKPGIYNGLQKISIPLFGVLSTALLAHEVLTKAEMGVWVNFLAITSFAEMFRSGIVRTSLIRFINYARKERHAHIMSAGFFLNVAITLVAILLLFFFSGKIEMLLKSPGLASMLHLYLIALFVLIFFSHLEWLMYAHLNFRSLFFTYLVRQGSTLLGILIWYLINKDVSLNDMVIIYTGGLILGTITGYLLTSDIFEHKLKYSRFWLLKLWNFGKYVFGTNLSTLIFRSSDQFLLSNLTNNPGIVASQNTSMRVINIADIPSQVVGDILYPRSSGLRVDKDRSTVKYYYERAVGATLSFILPFILFTLIFPKLIILVIAGSKYLDAIPYLRLAALSTFFLAFLKQWGVIIDSTGRPQLNFIILVLMSILQVTFCFLLIPKYQLMGAAYALIITHILGFAITQVLLNRFFKINFINCLKYTLNFYPELFRIATSRLPFFKK